MSVFTLARLSSVVSSHSLVLNSSLTQVVIVWPLLDGDILERKDYRS